MTPFELADTKIGDDLLDINTDRVMTAIHVHRFPEGDAVVFAAVNPEKFTVILGKDTPVPPSLFIVREYAGVFHGKIVTNDRQAVHQANVAIISAIDAARWEAVG